MKTQKYVVLLLKMQMILNKHKHKLKVGRQEQLTQKLQQSGWILKLVFNQLKQIKYLQMTKDFFPYQA